jgi:hypothetical protein
MDLDADLEVLARELADRGVWWLGRDLRGSPTSARAVDLTVAPAHGVVVSGLRRTSA